MLIQLIYTQVCQPLICLAGTFNYMEQCEFSPMRCCESKQKASEEGAPIKKVVLLFVRLHFFLTRHHVKLNYREKRMQTCVQT